MAESAKTRVADILADPRSKSMERTFSVDRASIDANARTVALSFASEEPVERWFGREILECSAKACDMTRLRNGAAVLVNHNMNDQVGVVMEATCDEQQKKMRAVVKFSKSERGQEIFQDITDGIRSLVSVGYIVRRMEPMPMEDDDEMESHRVTSWQPFELSMVAVPADATVGVGRSQETPAATVRNTAPATTTTNPTSMADTATTTALAATTATVTVDHSAERQRIKDINAAAANYIRGHEKHADAIRSLATAAQENGDTPDQFARAVLDNVLATKPAAPAQLKDTSIGMTPKDVRRYCIMRGIQALMERRQPDGLEKECSDEVARKTGRTPTGFFLPDEVYHDRRTLTVGTPNAGGYLVNTDILTTEFVEYLRNNTTVVELGARYISGLKGDVLIPQQLTGSTAYWVTETGTITSSSATFGQILGKPRRIGTSVPYSKQFLAQSSLGAEQFVVADSDKAIAVDLDRVALRGIGGAEPLGVAYLATADRSTSVTFSTSPTWAKYLEFMSSVATNNALVGSPAYIASVASAVKASTVAKFSNTSDPIWNLDQGRVGPFRARWTTQLLTSATPVANMVIFGDWTQCIFLEWAGRDVVVDPYGTNATGGTVTVTIQRLIDMIVRRGKSFAQSADSGAQ